MPVLATPISKAQAWSSSTPIRVDSPIPLLSNRWAGLPFIALEFHGKGDRMFEGSADDRVLGKRGAFLTGAGWSRADYARFATKAEALAAAEAATNRRPKGLLLATKEA